jgi:predicted nuclease of predicted toxin-antitoxin system
MKIWVDGQLSPALAQWISSEFLVECQHIRDLGLRDAADEQIYHAARFANAYMLTKDSDFVDLLRRHGPPPKVLWVTCGNTSNARMKTILSAHLVNAIELFEHGESLVEIVDLQNGVVG